MKKKIKLLFLIFVVILPTIFLCRNTVVFAENNHNLKRDYGLYWFGKGNISEKFIPGVKNSFFDPTKKTVIYVHGWAPSFGAEINNDNRESFNYLKNDGDKYGLDIDAADAWIDDGWNIGVFYWDAFSDELMVWDAEAKIWSVDGPKGIRALDLDKKYYYNITDKSAGELFYDSYIQAMDGFEGDNIRIVGHSLGSQMASRLVGLIMENIDTENINNQLLPNRLVLLDPAWSMGSKSYLDNKWTGEMSRKYAKEFKERGGAIEFYRSTPLSEIAGDKNKELENISAYICMKPWYIPATDFQGLSHKHKSARDLYFLSYNSKAPDLYERTFWGQYYKIQGCAPNASVSDELIRKMMDSSYRYEQYTGGYTQLCDDDGYARIPRNSHISVWPTN